MAGLLASRALKQVATEVKQVAAVCAQSLVMSSDSPTIKRRIEGTFYQGQSTGGRETLAISSKQFCS